MTHAALKDQKSRAEHAEVLRSEVLPFMTRPWTRDAVAAAIAALSAMEGEAVAEVGRDLLGNKAIVSVYMDRLNVGDRLYTAPPPQQAATCHNCGVQCYGWHRCPPAHQPGEETKALVQRALDGLKVPKLSPSKTEYFTAGVRSLAQAINEQLRALAPKEAGHDR